MANPKPSTLDPQTYTLLLRNLEVPVMVPPVPTPPRKTSILPPVQTGLGFRVSGLVPRAWGLGMRVPGFVLRA